MSIASVPARAVGAGTAPTQPFRSGLAGEYEYLHGIHELKIVDPRSENGWASALATQPAEFALIEEGPVLLLGFRFGPDAEWAAALHTLPAKRSEGEGLTAAGGLGGERALLCVSVSEEPNHPPTARHNWTLSLSFSQVLNDALRERFVSTSDPKAHDRALDRILRRGPSIGWLVARSNLRCQGAM